MNCSIHNAEFAGSSDFTSVICVDRPSAGESRHVPSVAKALIHLRFDYHSAIFERDAADLIIKDGNGGVIILDNFFAVGDQPLPAFETMDGVVVPATEFLLVFDSGFDLSIAKAHAPPSGGTRYENDAGELSGGIDLLADLRTGSWNDEYGMESAGYAAFTPLPAEPGHAVAFLTDSPLSLALVEQVDQSSGFTSASRPLAITDSGYDLPELTLRFSLANASYLVTAANTAQRPMVIAGEHGELETFFDGSNFIVDYTLDARSETLAEGSVVKDLDGLTFTAVDPAGNAAPPQAITVTIIGTNDAPTAYAISTSITEQRNPAIAGYASVSGNLATQGHADDVDLGAQLTFDFPNRTGVFGEITSFNPI